MTNFAKEYNDDSVGEERIPKLKEFIIILNEELRSYDDNLRVLESNISKFENFYDPEPTALIEKSNEKREELLAVELERIINYIKNNNNRLSAYKNNIKTII